MTTILLVFVGALCLFQGMKVINMEERNKIFTKYPIVVNDVKKYNRFCGLLIIGFGLVAEVTLYFMVTTSGWVSLLCTLAILVEAFILLKIYNKGEKKFIQKR